MDRATFSAMARLSRMPFSELRAQIEELLSYLDAQGVASLIYAFVATAFSRSVLNRRNKIAHGRYLELDVGPFGDLVDQILELLRWFKTDLENAVATKAYMRLAAPAIP